MKTLHLTLKKKWFDMILSDEKKEEYREYKQYWFSRFINKSQGVPIKYDKVCFKNGYSKNAPEITIQCLGWHIGKAKPEWSDNWQGDVFVIRLGEILETRNCEHENKEG